MIRCIVVAEGGHEGTYKFRKKREFKAFARGLQAGISLYGGGSCGAFTLDDITWLEADGCEEFKERVALIKKHLTPREA